MRRHFGEVRSCRGMCVQCELAQRSSWRPSVKEEPEGAWQLMRAPELFWQMNHRWSRTARAQKRNDKTLDKRGHMRHLTWRWMLTFHQLVHVLITAAVLDEEGKKILSVTMVAGDERLGGQEDANRPWKDLRGMFRTALRGQNERRPGTVQISS